MSQTAHEYARSISAAADLPEDHAVKVFAGASSPLMAARESYAQAYDAACMAETWCAMRRLKLYGADAVAEYDRSTKIRLA